MPDSDSHGAGATSSQDGEALDLRTALRSQAKTSRKVSWLLDECIRIPGTDLRFGLDPILGLLPYGGETVATIIGAVVLGEAGKKGIPMKTLAKMSGNMVLNATVGVVPVLGDLFSVWFKSNSRNYKLLNTYLEDAEGKEASGGWGPFLFVVGTVGLVLTLNVCTWLVMILLVRWLVNTVLREFRG